MDSLSDFSADQRFSLLASAFAVAVGFAFSVVGSLFTFWMTRRSERIRAEEIAKAAQLHRAHLGFAKLITSINRLYSIEKTIDKQFSDAHSDGYLVSEPALALRPLVGFNPDLDTLEAAEFDFLFSTKHGQLITELQVVQSRIRTDFELVSRFSREREELSEFLINSGAFTGDCDGPSARFKLEGDLARKFEIRVGIINRYIADLIEILPKDRARTSKLAQDYRDAAESYFGPNFPKMSDIKEDSE